MFKPVTLAIVLVLFSSGYWFYNNLVTPQNGSTTRVQNLPWQITVVDDNTLHVLELNVGKDTLGQAVKVLKSEYNVAWFENEDNTLSLEAYFIRVSLSGLRAKVLLELDTEGLGKDYLLKRSGKPEIQKSRTIKYPVDDLAQTFATRVIRSLTYVPLTNLEPELIKKLFGAPQESLTANQNTDFWLYPEKGLVISLNKRGKEIFQYIPIAQFDRLKNSILATVDYASKVKSSD